MEANEEIIENKIDDLYMVFIINNQKYALSSKYIIEIIEMLPITKVPFLPNYMKGIINLRSTIIPVMDARMRFDMEPIEYNERTCIIIIENDSNKIGLIVDAVNEVINISPNQSMNMNSNNDESKENFIKGVSEINDEVQLILDCDSLMKIVEDIKNEINE
ncbi:chemotaxis protein CheW [Paraclostridium sordellii]|uniref:Chemotaxis protein CheW n=1 Tax=Paraclostridium sordellii TaxID=1505 RepID=A0A0C7QY45_PARSO|nr:chemotaxis protein CheW [Paeniclostridium sordellii]CEN21396.1 chemotaxis protein CheW [[Clostridium] sordellii] [Paeniclostridium sordellii]CEN79181.1 chemotaxis protein CheW [[Clostridium] sordellii] [Paeniclostridium sordellii]CEP81377.1 chemotaxis protein CheW [[Clostridium] sordellii] [Paeniclostridium sordellii]CEP88365.1 chemotaxis protein CheW [[Clostridium] sordellii] [Paeniclostridium sordellii]CEP97016.1 chemotaxis protein CheW [[Clostridium] sordellii] [Paeniclostridium sordelli